MIEKMHEKSGGWVFKIIFALVSLSFVLGGIGGGLMATDNSVAKVNGEEISQQVFSRAKNQQQNILNAQLGERFWDLMDNPIYVKQFHESILNGLVDDELLRQYAKSLKIDVSADQIKSEIVNSPAFKQDGKFNNNLYQQALRNNGLTADGYAAIVYEGMLFAQIQEAIVNSSFTVPAQQELLAKLLLQKRQVRLATYSIAKEVNNQTASAEEMQAYYEANKANFVNPEKLTVEYISIEPKDLANKIQVTNEQIDTYYQTNKAKYTTKGEAKIAHIQVATEAEANEIVQALAKGEDFAQLAKAKSQDKLSAAQGGDLGWAKAGVFPKAFEDAANMLDAGKTSQPIKVDNAFHIIKVLERNVETVVPLEKVKAQITDTIRNELLLTEYSNITREMANVAFENSGSLEAVAKVANVLVHKTDAFTRETVPAELDNEKVLRVLFDSEVRQNGQNSEAIDLSDATNTKTMFVRVSHYQAENVQTFDEAKSAVEQAVKQQKALKVLEEKATTQVAALNKGETVEVAFGASEELVFAQAQITEPALAQAVFSMAKPAEKPTYQTARNTNGDVVVIALDKVSDGTADEFKPLQAQFNQAERVVLRNDLLKNLRERAKIEVNQDFLDQLESSK
ncbi:SurA N-terminal domain-containing protein [Glaesserella parasuis]|uniref:SurA N-terminal domain-containing protein n=1 Tax=Glaesserella parasuis TaxID=738 RepID=UPI0002CA2680|nr:SurA N-terminal domain-containing protein [Glaesserella parasuis]EMY46664.1 peptidyl-prolyl cis-trans isomerase D [Glaesserella parasuis gx033]MDG6239433.1 SurA N-terminal domain-containing protein [Glaesserella parasuis]MDG6248076.1 SurA N-terminal domain-containing protein [Glaesserella parasuis]MDG6286350.1 SurA N-terminal domain-containing protein [Glaesserella parasuis]MDG6288531.1 SurA N-terminal domain-containing protein [Glaesserella parasuis]